MQSLLQHYANFQAGQLPRNAEAVPFPSLSPTLDRQCGSHQALPNSYLDSVCLNNFLIKTQNSKHSNFQSFIRKEVSFIAFNIHNNFTISKQNHPPIKVPILFKPNTVWCTKAVGMSSGPSVRREGLPTEAALDRPVNADV